MVCFEDNQGISGRVTQLRLIAEPVLICTLFIIHCYYTMIAKYYIQRLSFIIAILSLLQSHRMSANRPSRTQIMEKALLKAILPFVASPQEHKSPFLLLGRISAVSFNHKSSKEKKPKCTVCGAVYENYLLFVLHIELMHSVHFKLFRTK